MDQNLPLPLVRPPTTIGSRSGWYPLPLWTCDLSPKSLSACWVGEAWGTHGVAVDSGKIMSPCWVLCRRRTRGRERRHGRPRRGLDERQLAAAPEWLLRWLHWQGRALGIRKEQTPLSPTKGTGPPSSAATPPLLSSHLPSSVSRILWCEMLLFLPFFPTK